MFIQVARLLFFSISVQMQVLPVHVGNPHGKQTSVKKESPAVESINHTKVVSVKRFFFFFFFFFLYRKISYHTVADQFNGE